MALTEIKTEDKQYFVDENGLSQGEYKSWYLNGNPHVCCYYVNGEFHGEYKRWENGIIFVHCHFFNGKKYGEYKSWHLNGNPHVCCYYVNGKMHGEYKRWRPDGNVFAHSLYANGTKICDLESPSEEDKILLSLKHGVTNWL